MTFILDVPIVRTFMGFMIIGWGFYLFYRYMLPKIHPFSMLGAMLRHAATATVVMLFLALLFLSPQMRWTLNWNDWVWNFVFARAIENPFSAHVFSYITIPLVYFGALWITRNEFFSFAYAASCAFIHEMVWFGFTTAFAMRAFVSTGVYWNTVLSSSAFAFMICAFGAVIIHVYKVNWKIVVWPFLYTILFDCIWFWMNDWKITVTIFDVLGRTEYASTEYYWDIGANLFENVGWLTLVPVMLAVLYFMKPKLERLLGREFDELSKHGWFK